MEFTSFPPSTQPLINYVETNKNLSKVNSEGKNENVSSNIIQHVIDPFHPKNLTALIQISDVWDNVIFKPNLFINEYLQLRATCTEVNSLIDSKSFWDEAFRSVGSPYELESRSKFQAVRTIYRFFNCDCTQLRLAYCDPVSSVDPEIDSVEKRNLRFQGFVFKHIFNIINERCFQPLLIEKDDRTKAYASRDNPNWFTWFPKVSKAEQVNILLGEKNIKLNEDERKNIKSFNVKNDATCKLRFRFFNKDFVELNNLVELKLNNCSIKFFKFNFEDENKLDFPHLKILDLSNNPLKNFSFFPKAPENLEYLNLGQSRLKEISFHVGTPVNLKYLSLGDCTFLKKIFGLHLLINLKQINIIKIHSNFRINELHLLPKLQYMFIDKCPWGFKEQYEKMSEENPEKAIFLYTPNGYRISHNISSLVNVSNSVMKKHRNKFEASIMFAFIDNEDVGDKTKEYFMDKQLKTKRVKNEPGKEINRKPRKKKGGDNPTATNEDANTQSMDYQAAIDIQGNYNQIHFNQPVNVFQNNFYPQFDQQFGMPQNNLNIPMGQQLPPLMPNPFGPQAQFNQQTAPFQNYIPLDQQAQFQHYMQLEQLTQFQNYIPQDQQAQYGVLHNPFAQQVQNNLNIPQDHQNQTQNPLKRLPEDDLMQGQDVKKLRLETPINKSPYNVEKKDEDLFDFDFNLDTQEVLFEQFLDHDVIDVEMSNNGPSKSKSSRSSKSSNLNHKD